LASDGKQKPLWRRVFSIWFFLNVVLSFIVTLWLPLAKTVTRATGAGLPEEGQILREETRPAWRVYQSLAENPGAIDSWIFVALHIGIVVAITYLVWLVVLGIGGKQGAPNEAGQAD
jgi:hypothetical protein